jgi:hypothetical protein
LDAAEPPRIVLERPAQCRESDRAEGLLRRALTSAVAPGHGWSVAMRVDRAGATELRAQGEITDGDGVSVAHRTIAGTASDCSGLARAVGVWASLVLDAEVRKAGAAGATSSPRDGNRVAAAIADGSPIRGVAGSAEKIDAGRGETGPPAPEESPDAPTGAATGLESPGAWPAPALSGKASPEHDWYLHHDEGRTLELGVGLFLMTGTGGGALAGPTGFVVVEAGHGVFLRPSLAFGESVPSLPPADIKASTWGAARFDTCLRLPGLYTRRQGMQLDLCGGTDVGYTTIQALTGTTLPYVDLGPSIDLRGELGSRLSAVLRVVAGVNLVRPSFLDLSGAREQLPLAEGRLEVAFSWDVR